MYETLSESFFESALRSIISLTVMLQQGYVERCWPLHFLMYASRILWSAVQLSLASFSSASFRPCDFQSLLGRDQDNRITCHHKVSSAIFQHPYACCPPLTNSISDCFFTVLTFSCSSSSSTTKTVSVTSPRTRLQWLSYACISRNQRRILRALGKVFDPYV